ncbi:hypothetical protein LINGRAHAP2_LOCUS14086 [Linum grandiflorum]
MEKYFGNAYRGDPGVPHAQPERFWNIWIASASFSAVTWFNPYIWHWNNAFNWHDLSFLHDQYHWKKAKANNKPYKFHWNEKGHDFRESYYHNWPNYFR